VNLKLKVFVKRINVVSTDTKEKKQLVEEMRALGEGIITFAENTIDIVRSIGAAMMEQEHGEEESKTKLLSAILSALISAINDFTSTQPSAYDRFINRVRPFLDYFALHKIGVIGGGIGLGLAGGVLGAFAAGAIHVSCTGGVCAAAATAGTITAGMIGSIALGAGIGVLLAIVAVCVYVHYKNKSQPPGERDLMELKKKLDALKDMIIPSIENLQEMRWEILDLLSDLVPIPVEADTICYVCHETIHECTQHPHGKHTPTCAARPFPCRHIVCRKCSREQRLTQCGMGCQRSAQNAQR
jgi:hypothetical protein